MSPGKEVLLDIDWKVKWSLLLVFALCVAAILLALVYGIFAFSMNDYQRATDLAAFASGVATVILVGITGWYAYETRRLVGQTEQAREDERRREEIRRQRGLDNLRKALINEIGAVEDLDELAEEYMPTHSAYQQLISSTVYDNSAEKIGSLTAAEVEAIVEYYTLGEIVDDYLSTQRKLDTKLEMNRFERIWHSLSFEWVFSRREKKARAEATAERISELAAAQDEALRLLKQNLREKADDEF